MNSELKMTPRQLQEVFEHVDDHRHSEVCGFLVLDSEHRVERIVRARNVAWHTGGLYLMDASSLLDATTAYLDGHPIVVYHSHPNMSPVPSVIDTSDAEEHPHDWRYLIVGQNEFALWRLGDDDEYEQIEIEILEDEPAPAA